MQKRKAKAKTERISFTLTEEMKSELDRMAAKQHIPVSELLRKYAERGMHIEKSKDDVDFIRKQIREELDPILYKYMNRLIKLIVRVGTMTISMCFFTSKVLYILLLPHKESVDYDVMFNDAKHKAAAYLKLKDEEVEKAHRDIMNDIEKS